MPEFDFHCSNGQIIKMIEEDGLVYTTEMLEKLQIQNFKKHLEAVQYLPIRDDDVYIAAFAKSGTHWVWEIVTMILKGKAEYEKKPKGSAMLDFSKHELISKLPSPRVLNSHHPVHLIPLEVKEKKTKIIHVLRNPKDVAVSLYNMVKKMTFVHSLQTESFSDSLLLFTGQHGIYRFYSWCKFILEWEQFSRENPDQILNLYFEDLKENAVREIHKVKSFLNIDLEDKVVEEIADACGFEKLKKASEEFKDTPVSKKLSKDGGHIIHRKGEVGDWKNWFTVAENEHFDEWLAQNLTNTDLKIRYEL